MAQFHLQIVTPDGISFDGMADSVLVRLDSGDIQIMRGHADYFAPLGIGRAKIVVGTEEKLASAAGGFLSVMGGEVRIVATTFEFAENIDIARARRAKEEAEETLRNAKDERYMKVAKAKLARAINRINIAELI